MSELGRYGPCPELQEVLLPAFAWCTHLKQECYGEVHELDPRAGYIPRGVLGALGELSEVQLVLVFGEPAGPISENYGGIVSRSDRLESTCRHAYRHLESSAQDFHVNTRWILDLCWPGLSLAEQLRKTWVTESALCSAITASSAVRANAWHCCVDHYLVKQLALLEGAAIVACGNAQPRVKRTGYEALPVKHPSTRNDTQKAEARESWRLIPGWLRSHGAA